MGESKQCLLISSQTFFCSSYLFLIERYFYVSVLIFNESNDAWIAFNRKNFVARQTFSATFHFHITLYLLIYWKYWINGKAFMDCSTANFNLSSFLLDSADCAKMVFIVFSRRHTLNTNTLP